MGLIGIEVTHGESWSLGLIDVIASTGGRPAGDGNPHI